MKTNKKAKKVEILAPAGSSDSFFAAIQAGADAVYLGMKEFSARAYASNFSISELERMIPYAHSIGKKVFVTLNTIIKEHELSKVTGLLDKLFLLQPDAVIVQDLGLLKLIQSRFPSQEIHSSTQMQIHNSLGAMVLASCGVKRVILERQITQAELAQICEHSEVDLEIFIHGALCFSLSGACLASSYMGGKSGNRGGCTQPCRRKYYESRDNTSSKGKKNGFFFSPGDLFGLDVLSSITNQKIVSLKIEGRMKPAEYVGKVTSAYRRMVDAGLEIDSSLKNDAYRTARQSISDSFGRRWTSGLYEEDKIQEVIQTYDGSGTGRRIGRLAKSDEKKAIFKTNTMIHLGDRLRIQPQDGSEGVSFSVTQIYIDGRPKKVAKNQDVVAIPCGKSLKERDWVYKTSSRAGKKREYPKVSDLPSFKKLILRVDIKSHRGEVRCDHCAPPLKVERSWEALQAENRNTTLPDLARELNRVGKNPIVIQKVEGQVEDGILVKAGDLKRLRQEFLKELKLEDRKWQPTEALKSAISAPSIIKELHKKESVLRRSDGKLSLYLRCRLDQATHSLPRQIKQLIIPLAGDASGAGDFLNSLSQLEGLVENCKSKNMIAIELPYFISESRLDDLKQSVLTLQKKGVSHWRINNISHLGLGLEGQITATYPISIANSLTLSLLQDKGVSQFEVTPELDRELLLSLSDYCSQYNLGLQLYGYPTLFYSRFPQLAPQKIEDKKGEPFQPREGELINTTIAGRPFWLMDQIKSFEDLGYSFGTLDVSHDKISPKQALDTLAKRPKRAKTFNYEIKWV